MGPADAQESRCFVDRQQHRQINPRVRPYTYTFLLTEDLVTQPQHDSARNSATRTCSRAGPPLIDEYEEV